VTFPRDRGGVALLVLVAAVLAVVLPALVSAPTAASTVRYASPASPRLVAAAPAATPASPSVLTLSSITPPVTGPGVSVTITGTLTARTTDLAAPTVRVVLGTTPIISRASVTAWTNSTAALAGLEVGNATVPGPLAAGASAPFSITVPPGRFTLNRPFGVIPVAIQVRDSTSGTTEVLRTFVGWQRMKQYEPIRLAMVAPVTLSPTAALFQADEATRASAWETELGPTGRISRILDGTDVAGPSGPVPVTWAVDPAVLKPVPATTGGSDATSSLVSPLVNRLATGASRHTLWALPNADPDLAATVVTRPDDPTVAREVGASTGLAATLGVPVTTGIAWPVDGSFAADREAGLRQAYSSIGLQAVVGSSSALPVTSGYSGQAPRRTASGLTLLAWDDELSRLTTQLATPADGVVTAQRFLAQTATILGESSGVARSFLVAMPRSADPDPGALKLLLTTLTQTPWVQFVTTGDLQQQAATQDSVANTSKGSWDLAGAAQIDGARLDRIADERKAADEIATVLGPDGQAYGDQWKTALDQLTSVRWRSDPEQFAKLEASVSSAAAAATSGISVADQTTNFLADEGTLQIVVVNNLSVPVEGVRLVLEPANPRLRIVAQPDPVNIGAKSRAVVAVRAEALAAGLVPVDATLTTNDGTPIGLSGTITVRANPPGYWFYLIGGAVVLLILIFGIVRTVRRPRTPPAPPPPPAPDPGIVPTPDDPAVPADPANAT
jgi:Family of unknown function (DUF6049)